jgi:hypothetical protein
VSGRLDAPAALPPGKQVPVPVVYRRRLGGPLSWSRYYGEEEILLSLTGIEPRFLGHPASILVAITTELSRLHIAY